MKLIALALATAALLTGAANVRAQADIMIKQKARQLENQPPRGPGPAAPASAPAQPAKPTPTPTPAPVPAGPALTTQQLQLIDKLANELSGIKAGSTVTAEQKQSLENAAAALGNGATKASKTSVTKLATDLSGALSGKDVSAFDRSQLAKAINVVLNSGSMTSVQVQTAVTTAQNSLKAASVQDADVKTVVADLRSVVADLQKSKPALYR